MKTFKLFIVLIPLLTFFACCEDTGKTETEDEKTEVDEKERTEVEKYVDALRNNQYDDRYLPAFTYEHIDELLMYRNEKDIITNFPRNPVSSLWLWEWELGIYILWTIESIRVLTITTDSDILFFRFPSGNPVLRSRESEKFESIFDVERYQIASDAYYAWWTNNKDKTIEEIMAIDPLENTIYRWR